MVAPLITGPNRIPRADAGRTGAQDETINNLVLANRILASRELGILGTTGHVSVHGEIFKARPDVMAVLHAHTPEILAFTENSVALRPVVNGAVFIGDGLPMHDIRKFDPRENIIRTSELGQTVATVLGKKPAVLLKGHGIALTGSSLQHRHQPPQVVDITVHGSTGSRSFRLTSK